MISRLLHAWERYREGRQGEAGHLLPPWLRQLLLLAFFGAVAAGLYSRSWLHLGSTIGGAERDGQVFTWFFAWDWYAVSHGLSPFFSDRIAVPGGANLMWNTAVPLWGTVLGPLTATLGPATATVIGGTLGLTLAGYATFWLGRDWLGTTLGPILAGLFFEICPFLYVHAHGSHLHLVMGAFWIPLMALLAGRLARNHGSPIAVGVLLGMSAAGELLTAEELLAISAVVFMAALVVLVVMHPRLAIRRSRHFVTGAIVALATFGVLAAVPLAAQLWGSQSLAGRDIQGDYGGAAFYSLDAVNLVVPTQFERFAPPGLVDLSRSFIGTPAEQTGYIGIPILLVFAGPLVILRDDRLVRWLLVTTLLIILFALGASLHVLGQVLPHVPLPMRAVGRLPALENLLPVRYTLLMYLALALLLARIVDTLWGRRRFEVPWRGAAAAVAAIALLTVLPSGRIPTHALSSQPYLQDRVPRDATVVVFPYPAPETAETMYWSAASDVRYRQVGGAISVPDPTRPKGAVFNPQNTTKTFWWAVVDAARTGRPVDASLVQQERQELRRYGVQYVVMAQDDRVFGTRGSPLWSTSRSEVTRLVGFQPQEEEGALVWRVG